MPEAVLAGPDGKPAIDAATGMPLTMEELLRRRGILAVKGVVSPLNQGGTPIATSPAEQALADAANATSTNSDSSTAAIGASPNTLDANGVPIGATPATPTNMPVGSDGSGGDGSNIWPWVAGSAGVAAAAYGARKLGRRGSFTDRFKPEDYSLNTVSRDPIVEDAQWEEIGPDRIGSNRRLDPLLDGKNASHADQVGAGPKALTGMAPVTDVSHDNSLTSAFAQRSLSDLETRRVGTRTRLQQGAVQANNARVQAPGNTPIQLTDQFTDISPEEMGLAKQLASRIRTDRVSGAAARSRGVRTAGRGAGLPSPAPVYDTGSELTEAVRLVRQMRTQGVNTHMLAPLIRRLR